MSQRILDRLFPGAWQEANRNPAYDNPPDLLQLSSELAKLVTAADGKEINARHIDALVPQCHRRRICFPSSTRWSAAMRQPRFKLLSGDETDDDVASRYLNQLASRADKGQAFGRGAAVGPRSRRQAGRRDQPDRRSSARLRGPIRSRSRRTCSNPTAASRPARRARHRSSCRRSSSAGQAKRAAANRPRVFCPKT